MLLEQNTYIYNLKEKQKQTQGNQNAQNHLL